ncbi:uncharacterized protein LOC143484396 [Brachyhypopomus gauderio]|uniref:uncharacterized protein LOC143484396 n=1 Tax=Brachyhypopomus gauderio TaxID=698409 RepID=UPI004041E3E0
MPPANVNTTTAHVNTTSLNITNVNTNNTGTGVNATTNATAIQNTTSITPANANTTTALMNTTNLNITNVNTNNTGTGVNATTNATAIHNTTSIPPANVNTTTANVNTTSLNITNVNTNNTGTGVNATTNATAIHNTTSIPPAQANITTAHLNTTSLNSTQTGVNATTNVTGIHNTTSMPPANVNTTTAHVNTTSLNSTQTGVNATTNATAIHNTTSITPANANTTTALMNTTNLNITNVNTNNTGTGVNATTNATAIHNTTSIPPANVNTTTAHVNTTSLNSTQTGVNSTTNATGLHNTTSMPPANVNTTSAHVNTTSLNITNVNTNNTGTGVNATTNATAIQNTTSIPPANANTTTALMNTTNLNITNVNTNNTGTGVNATTNATAIHNTTSIPPANVNTTTAHVNTTSLNSTQTGVNSTTNATGLHNTTSMPPANVNTTSAHVNTTSLNITNVNTNNTGTGVNATTNATAIQNTTSIPPANANTTTALMNTTNLNITNVNTNNTGTGVNATTNATAIHNTTSIPPAQANITTAHLNTTSLNSTQTGVNATTNVTGIHNTTSIPPANVNTTTAHVNTTSLNSTQTGVNATTNATGIHNTTSIPPAQANTTTTHVNTTRLNSTQTGVNATTNATGIHNTTSIPPAYANTTTAHLNTTSLNSTQTGVNATTNATVIHNTTTIPPANVNTTTAHVNTTNLNITNVNTNNTGTGVNATTNATVIHNTTSIPPANVNTTTAHVNTTTASINITATSIPSLNLAKLINSTVSSGALTNTTQMKLVFNQLETGNAFTNVDEFLTALTSQGVTNIIPPVRDVMMNETFKIISPQFSQFVISNWTDWFTVKLVPLLPSFTAAMFINATSNITCTSYTIIVNSLDSVGSNLSSSTQTQIFTSILQLLTGPNGLRCYTGGSFYLFLHNTFLRSEFPDLSVFLSLIPANRLKELLGSISPVQITEFLNTTKTVNSSDVCTVLNNYNQTNQYLQTQPVQSPVLARQMLECVWPLALSVSSQVDVNQWFNVYLAHYLPYLSYQLIRPAQLNTASCLSYRKLVSVLGNNYNFSNTNFTSADVYNSIKAYLTSSSGTPRCYNSSDPNLNSTAWFTNNIGPFITFMSLSDLQTFVSDSQIGVFAVDSDNLQLFNTSGIPANVTEYYVTQLYNQNPNFNPVSLPAKLLCSVPASAFVHLGDSESKTTLNNINSVCTTISPEVIAALVSNFNPTLTPTSIQLLGNESVGLTQSQLSSASPAVINSSLPVLSTVIGWNQGQANAIVQSVISAGFSIKNASSLLALGTLIGGVPSATISSISSSELLSVSQNPTFINNILTAPVVLQETYVEKIVSINQPQAVVNVPNALATFIPRVILTSLDTVNVTVIDMKTWNQAQAVVLFSSVTSVTSNPDNIPGLLLAGFSSTSAQALPVTTVKQVVKACRPQPGRSKVPLQESQLTSMYNYVKGDSSFTFSDVHPDMLLYYDYNMVQTVNCSSYFSALGAADFSIPSSFLNIQKTLFKNAQTCLGISGFNLTNTQLGILGNMICTLDSSYIQNSDPLIIENLKNCGDLTASQVTGIQTLLFSGNTPYGNPSTWKLQTLQQLGNLPLHFTRGFWAQYTSSVKKTFMQSFMPVLRSANTPVIKLQSLFTECNSNFRSRRAAGCTAGEITEVTITDPSFPIGYDSTQFDLCLNVTMLTSNVAAITQKVVDIGMERVILNKLNQAYPSGLGDSVLQLLGSTSRVANVSEINSWNITTIDTLSSLMNPTNGAWTSEQSNAVIMNYLRVSGNTLGRAEINVIMSNICSLNATVLSNISANSLRLANPMNVSSCSINQKTALYNIANISFSPERSNVSDYFLLISSYLGGAPLSDIITLAAQNISMDITTFINLNPNVLMSLNVSTVSNLLGTNLPTLKMFESNPLVRSWEGLQYQSQLNTLGIGLTGGINSTTPSPTNTSATTVYINASMTTTNSTAGYAAVHRDAGPWCLSLIVGLLMVTFHVVQ